MPVRLFMAYCPGPGASRPPVTALCSLLMNTYVEHMRAVQRTRKRRARRRVANEV